MTRTCLIQSLLLVDYLETQDKTVTEAAVILPFSSGILAAYALSAACNVPSFIMHAIDAFKVAFWIGRHVQSYRHAFLSRHNIGPSLPWSIVVTGLSAADARHLLKTTAPSHPSLSITAITDTTCVTISGHPDDLLSFRRHCMPKGCTTHDPGLFALYHSHLNANGLHEDILRDLDRRQIPLSAAGALRIPIRSSATSDILKGLPQVVLKDIIRSITTLQANWQETMLRQLQLLSPDGAVDVVNVGPGCGLARLLQRRLLSRAFLTDLCEEGTPMPQISQVPIAITGMAVRVPGARTADELWSCLRDGMNMASSIPDFRFRVSDYTNGDHSSTSRKMKASMGNFIDGVDEFDAAFFGISPREARSMDPQQRILLQTSYEALESAGYVPDTTPTSMREIFGCFVGAATNDYVHNLRNDIDVCYSSGTLQSFLSGRISYALKLGGPSLVLDTACSSSMVAIHAACRALASGDCTAALAGGVNIIASPDMFMGLDRAHMLSPTGQCRSFDASADGYCRGEGSCMFVLKKLTDAIAEKDAILGVIRGAEVNHSGDAPSITHPHAEAQASLFRRLMRNANVAPSRVSVVEAHGTGTQAGDPTELQSIRDVLAAGQRLHVTSIKANIGHLEAASGAAAVAKVLLMFQHRKLPPQISLKVLNPRIAPLEKSNMHIDTILMDWEVDGEGSRLAVVNNFGIAGSNATVLLEEHLSPTVDDRNAGRAAYTFGISAKTLDQLDERRTALCRWLREASPSISLSDIAYSLTARNQVYSHRLAAVTQAKEPIIFVFSGQGGQYLGMGEQLYETSTIFRRVVDDCERVLLGSGLTGARDVIVGTLRCATDQQKIEAYQAATFVLECGLLEMYKSWGIVPDAVAGHSLGEYVALVAAQVLTREDALYIVGKRARLMTSHCGSQTTSMIAIKYPPIDVQELLVEIELFRDLSITCYNGPSECVVGGPLAQLESLQLALKARSIPYLRLQVPFGFHSKVMAPIVDALDRVCEAVMIRPPSLPIASNVLGTVIPSGDTTTFTPLYFARHCLKPVRFHDNVHALLHDVTYSQAIWMELGPHSTTLPMVKSCASASQLTPLCLPSLRRQEDSWASLSATLSQLYLTNTPVKWREVFSDIPSVRNIAFLPRYPFAKDKFWVPFREDHAGSLPVLPQNSDSTPRSTFRTAVGDGSTSFSALVHDSKALIEGHAVAGWPLYPASLYLEQIFSAADLALFEIACPAPFFAIREVKFLRALVFRPEEERIVLVKTAPGGILGNVCVSSSVPPGAETLHASAEYRLEDPSRAIAAFGRHSPVLRHTILALSDDPESRLLDKEAVYKGFSRVVKYARQYQVVDALRISGDGDDSDDAASSSRTIFLDAMLHEAYICVSVGKDLRIYADVQTRGDSTTCATSFTLLAKISDAIFHRTLATPLEPFVKPSNDTAAAIVGEALGIQTDRLAHDVDLHDYGLDSLTSIEARHLFKTKMNVQLPVDFFLTCVPERRHGLDAENLQPRLIQQPSTGEQDPLILIHDGSGLIDHYERLPPMDRQLWGIPSPAEDGTESLKEMAASYAKFIGRTFSVPVILGGWSFGGVVAYEAACLLAAQGVAVRGVVLIDSPCPAGHVPLSPAVINMAIGLNAGVGSRTLRPLLEAQFARNSRLLAEYEPLPGRASPRLAFLRCRSGFSSSAVAGCVPQWLTNRSEGNREIVEGWETLAGERVRVWDIPGHHFEPFLPANIDTTSIALTEACCYLAHADAWPQIPKL
ncbi:hypothetical protein HDZ31DRAFT_85590 [Schizophyllum fasciatum]